MKTKNYLVKALKTQWLEAVNYVRITGNCINFSFENKSIFKRIDYQDDHEPL